MLQYYSATAALTTHQVGGWDDAGTAAVMVTPSTVRATRLSYANVDALLRKAAREARQDGGAEAAEGEAGEAAAAEAAEAAEEEAAAAALAAQGVDLQGAVATLVRSK